MYHYWTLFTVSLNWRTGILSHSQLYPQWLDVSGHWWNGWMDIYKGLAHPGQELGTGACDMGRERNGWVRQQESKIQLRDSLAPSMAGPDSSFHLCSRRSHFLLCWPINTAGWWGLTHTGKC